MPRNKLLAEWFWVDRWVESSVQALSIEARGLYREMLSHAWIRGARLPNDHEGIRRIVGCTIKEWRRAWPKIERYWTTDGDDLVNKTQREIYAYSVEFGHKKSLAGQIGNAARWGRKTIATASQPASQTDHKAAANTIPKVSPPSPSPSPSPYEDPPLKCAEDLSARAPARPRVVQGSGAGAGTFPRDHLRCSTPCGRVCLPEQLFAEFVKDCGGRYGDPDAYVRSWHRAVDETWGEGGPHWDTPVGDDKFAFWRARWRDDHGSTARAAERTQTPEEMAASVKRMLDEERAHKVGGRR